MKSSKKSKKSKIEEEVDESELVQDYIKPSNEGPRLDSADWPLLLKVKDKAKILKRDVWQHVLDEERQKEKLRNK